jgi:hypothetical protein
MRSQYFAIFRDVVWLTECIPRNKWNFGTNCLHEKVAIGLLYPLQAVQGLARGKWVFQFCYFVKIMRY